MPNARSEFGPYSGIDRGLTPRPSANGFVFDKCAEAQGRTCMRVFIGWVCLIVGLLSFLMAALQMGWEYFVR
jgi:hypothetical protein